MNLFANDLVLPEFWEVAMYYDKAEIHAGDEKMAEIDYALPHMDCCIDKVRWMLPDGHVYQIDYYDVYGCRYRSDLMDPQDKIEATSIFAPDGSPIMMMQPARNVLSAWNHGELLGHEKLQLPGLGKSGRDVLILTHTDQVEEIETLVKTLPECHFHIAALTAMSRKLLDLKACGNVDLYQGVSPAKREELFEICSYYLDINHYIEICDAVTTAYNNDLLILGFENTVHHSELMVGACIFEKGQSRRMAGTLKTAMNDRDLLIQLLKMQRSQKV